MQFNGGRYDLRMEFFFLILNLVILNDDLCNF